LAGQISNAPFQRAQENVERIRTLVKQGTLPQAALDEAEAKLADAQDEATLSDTLYSPIHAQDMTLGEEDEMVAAAARRLERAEERLEARQKLLDMGIISQMEMAGARNEVTERRLVLELAQNRVKVIEELRQMAASEQRIEIPTMGNSLIRYDGRVDFKLADLPGIERDFKAQFHRDLPVSALGQTALHSSMGLDHRNKVDVALNPEGLEGLWLRRYLERLQVSYLAFRTAVSGAATAAHIHIGSGSGRLRLVGR
jgi:multidrug resistance efflux pump